MGGVVKGLKCVRIKLSFVEKLFKIIGNIVRDFRNVIRNFV